MKFLWCDTETTGLEPENAAPIEVAFVFVWSGMVDGKPAKDECERLFFMNPFDIPGIELSQESVNVHGYTREKIETFDPSAIVCKKIDDCLKDFYNYRNPEPMLFAGYYNNFDLKHMVSIFSKHGLDFTKYFVPGVVDVFEQVKRAGAMKKLPYLPNRKLTTIAEHLNIDLTNAHDALGDIKATREVAKSLTKLGVPLK